jgi:N utilization substance protein A
MLKLNPMVIIKSEFFLALNQVATERGISPDDVVESIKSAVLAAYHKDYSKTIKEGENEKLNVIIDRSTGETRIYNKEKKDITPAGFGRIAAQTARQVILQKIREAEKKTVIKYYASQVGAVIKGRVVRYDGKNVYFDLGKSEGVLPYEGQIRNEKYDLNERFVVYLKEIRTDDFGNSKIILSRSEPKLVEELFKKEVPEIANNTVKIKKVVRQPGDRAKIAVYTEQSGVDPVGACVGQKGIRVKTVTDELGGEEKIDIIQWNKDPGLFIREALSPAKVKSVEIDEGKKKAKVLVNVEQAPLAIGKAGVNVDLASRLTDFVIDVVQGPGVPSKENSSEETSSKKEKQKESKAN